LTLPPPAPKTRAMSDTLSRLEAVIAARRGASPSESYVAKLHAKGLGKIAQKTGEEAVETVIAALSEDRAALVGEAADLLFHLLVLLGARDVSIGEVLAELDRREGVSGIAEKAARPPEAKPAPAPPPPVAEPAPAAPLPRHTQSVAPTTSSSPLRPMHELAEPALALGHAEPAKRPRIRKG
jgi:phosphoribosyl-ATP pyrophosphohydrolase